MTVGFFQIVSTDCLLALVLLGLFAYAARVSHGLRGIAAWGVAHLVYTVGAAMLDGAVQDRSGGLSGTAHTLIVVGGLMACGGMAGLGLAMTQFVQQRRLRRREKVLLPLSIAASLLAWLAWDTPDAQGAAMSAVEIAVLLVLLWQLQQFRERPYRVPARLMMLGCAALVVLYSLDLASAWTGEYGPNMQWINADISLWFMLNFCMLMLTSFRVADALRRGALIDPLTGALNRRGLNSALRRQFGRGTGMAVIAIDIDRFKAINDSHTHETGDLVLQRVSEAVRGMLRGGDLFARLGGDEFIVVADEAGRGPVDELAERIRACISALAFEPPHPPLRISASLGTCTLAPGMTFADALRHADAALYDAKRRGRDRVVAHGVLEAGIPA